MTPFPPKPSPREIHLADTKACTICKTDRVIEEFPVVKRTFEWAVGSWCKTCCAQRQRGYAKRNADRIRAYGKRYNASHREKINARERAYKRNHPELIKKRKAASYQRNKARRLEGQRRIQQRNKGNIQVIMKGRLRSRVIFAVRSAGTVKCKKTMEMVGCAIEHLLAHLASQFQPGMTWENRGEWHIDHIRPCASFDLTDPEQQHKCFHWTNLQPLWGKDNLVKGAKLDWQKKVA